MLLAKKLILVVVCTCNRHDNSVRPHVKARQCRSGLMPSFEDVTPAFPRLGGSADMQTLETGLKIGRRTRISREPSAAGPSDRNNLGRKRMKHF